MGGKCGVLRPVIEIESRIQEKIEFQIKEGERVTMVGTCLLSDLEPKKIIEVDKLKVKDYCHKHGDQDWRIKVLLEGNPTGLYLQPFYLLCCVRIIFEYKTLADGSRVLTAGGLSEDYFRSMVQLRGLGRLTHRNRKFKDAEERSKVKDIGEKVPLETQGTREEKAPKHWTDSQAGGCDLSSHMEKDLHDVADFPLSMPQPGSVVSSEEVAIGSAQPIVANDKKRADYMSLECHKHSITGSRNVATVSASDVEPEIQRWKHAIVGYLVAEDTEDHNVERYVSEQWRHFGSFKTYKLKPGVFLFNFTNGADKFKLLEQRQCFINNRPFILKRWMPNLSLDPSCFLATVPVWVRFPCLDLQFWSQTSLAKISSVIGELLFADEPTANKERLKYARVCIKIKLGDKLPGTIHIDVDDNDTIIEQAVQYEWKPRPCGYCCSLYHDSSACSLTSNLGASFKEGGNTIDLLSGDAETIVDDESDHNNLWEKDKVSVQARPLLLDEMPGLVTVGDDGHDANSTIVDVNCNAEDIFPGSSDNSLLATLFTQEIEPLNSSSSSLAMETAMENGTTDVLESEEDYSPTACLPSNKMLPWIGQSYYSKLKDMGLTIKRHFLG